MTSHSFQAQQLADHAQHYTYGDGADPTVGAALATEGLIHAVLSVSEQLHKLAAAQAPAVDLDDFHRQVEIEVRASIEAELSAIRDVPLPEYLRGTFNASTYRTAWLWCRAVVRGEQPKPYEIDLPDPRPAAESDVGHCPPNLRFPCGHCAHDLCPDCSRCCTCQCAAADPDVEG